MESEWCLNGLTIRWDRWNGISIPTRSCFFFFKSGKILEKKNKSVKIVEKKNKSFSAKKTYSDEMPLPLWWWEPSQAVRCERKMNAVHFPEIDRCHTTSPTISIFIIDKYLKNTLKNSGFRCHQKTEVVLHYGSLNLVADQRGLPP